MIIEKDKLETPYEKAYIEWSDRLGQTRIQLKTWRIAAIASILLALLLTVTLVMLISRETTYVYVAQLGPDQTAVNKVSLPQHFTPTQAQEAYFIGQFINNITSLPLDPVVARQNWFDAYSMTTGQAQSQLTAFAQTLDPFDNLGIETKSVQISNINAVSNNSIQVTWTATTYNSQGQTQDQTTYNGVFTFVQSDLPQTTDQLLKNPFGLKITYFSINQED